MQTVNFVAGAWREPSAHESLETRNPATGELLGHVPLSSADDVDAAVRAPRSIVRVLPVLQTHDEPDGSVRVDFLVPGDPGYPEQP